MICALYNASKLFYLLNMGVCVLYGVFLFYGGMCVIWGYVSYMGICVLIEHTYPI